MYTGHIGYRIFLSFPGNRRGEGMSIMEKGMFLAVVLLLTGCPGPGDRSVDRKPTAAFIRGKTVCVVSSLEPGERITAVQIRSGNSGVLHKDFDDTTVYIPRGDCLPVFGVKFTSGERYSVAWDVQSEQLASHLVTAEILYP